MTDSPVKNYAAPRLYVWFAENKGTERDGEQFIRAWTHDLARVDGLRNAIGKEPTIYSAILQAATRDTETIAGKVRSTLKACVQELKAWMKDHGQDLKSIAAIKSAEELLQAATIDAPSADDAKPVGELDAELRKLITRLSVIAHYANLPADQETAADAARMIGRLGDALAATAQPPKEDAVDAQRWRETLKHISLMLSGGRRIVWNLDSLPIPQGLHYYGPERANPETIFIAQIDASIAAIAPKEPK